MGEVGCEGGGVGGEGKVRHPDGVAVLLLARRNG
jgi:hypothetical protein